MNAIEEAARALRRDAKILKKTWLPQSLARRLAKCYEESARFLEAVAAAPKRQMLGFILSVGHPAAGPMHDSWNEIRKLIESIPKAEP